MLCIPGGGRTGTVMRPAPAPAAGARSKCPARIARGLRQLGLRPSAGLAGRLDTLTEFDGVHSCNL
jgi:hypothetical protein